jgi:hypothetical protein
VLTDAGYYLGFCVLGGTAVTGAPCGAPTFLRAEPSQLCVAGEVCTYVTSSSPTCTPSCDATASDAGCPAGTTCRPYFEGGDQFTACL